jgi:hypothetical protein
MQLQDAPYLGVSKLIIYYQYVKLWHKHCKRKGRDGMEGIMQKLIKAFENMMVAVTFAEAGEYDEARMLSVQDHEDVETVVSASSDMKAVKKA